MEQKKQVLEIKVNTPPGPGQITCGTVPVIHADGSPVMGGELVVGAVYAISLPDGVLQPRVAVRGVTSKLMASKP